MDDKKSRSTGLTGVSQCHSHPLDLSGRGKIPVIPGATNVFHTTRLCEPLVQPKSEFDLTDPNGYLWSTEYSCLHDPNLRTYLYRRDVHQRLLKEGLITGDERVVCSVRRMNQYREHLMEVEKDWQGKFRTEQRALVRGFLTLQEQGKTPRDITMPDITDKLLRRGMTFFRKHQNAVEPRPAASLGVMRNTNLVKLPSPTKQSDTAERTQSASCRSEKVWRSKSEQILREVTKEVQRELRVQRHWAKRRERQRRPMFETRQRQKRAPDTKLLPEDRQASGEDPGEDYVHPCGPLTPTEEASQQTFAGLCADLAKAETQKSAPAHHLFTGSGAADDVAEQDFSITTADPGSGDPADLSSSILSDDELSPLVEHFSGEITPEELQMILKTVVGTTVDEVVAILLKAVMAFQNEHLLASESSTDIPICTTSNSDTSSNQPSIQSSTSEVLTPPKRTSEIKTETWTIPFPCDLVEMQKSDLEIPFQPPSESLLLKVEDIIMDKIGPAQCTVEPGHAVKGQGEPVPAAGRVGSALGSQESARITEERDVSLEETTTTAGVKTEVKEAEGIDANYTSENDETMRPTYTKTRKCCFLSSAKSAALSSDLVDEILVMVKCMLEEEGYISPGSDDTPCMFGLLSPYQQGWPTSSPLCCVSGGDEHHMLQLGEASKDVERPLSQREHRGETPCLGNVLPLVSEKSPYTLNRISPRSLSGLNPKSVLVIRWLLQTIQKRHGCLGQSNTDPAMRSSCRARESDRLCEAIQALLEKLNHLNVKENAPRRSGSQTDVGGQLDQSDMTASCSCWSKLQETTMDSICDILEKLVTKDLRPQSNPLPRRTWSVAPASKSISMTDLQGRSVASAIASDISSSVLEKLHHASACSDSMFSKETMCNLKELLSALISDKPEHNQLSAIMIEQVCEDILKLVVGKLRDFLTHKDLLSPREYIVSKMVESCVEVESVFREILQTLKGQQTGVGEDGAPVLEDISTTTSDMMCNHVSETHPHQGTSRDAVPLPVSPPTHPQNTELCHSLTGMKDYTILSEEGRDMPPTLTNKGNNDKVSANLPIERGPNTCDLTSGMATNNSAPVDAIPLEESQFAEMSQPSQDIPQNPVEKLAHQFMDKTIPAFPSQVASMERENKWSNPPIACLPKGAEALPAGRATLSQNILSGGRLIGALASQVAKSSRRSLSAALEFPAGLDTARGTQSEDTPGAVDVLDPAEAAYGPRPPANNKDTVQAALEPPQPAVSSKEDVQKTSSSHGLQPTERVSRVFLCRKNNSSSHRVTNDKVAHQNQAGLVPHSSSSTDSSPAVSEITDGATS